MVIAMVTEMDQSWFPLHLSLTELDLHLSHLAQGRFLRYSSCASRFNSSVLFHLWRRLRRQVSSIHPHLHHQTRLSRLALCSPKVYECTCRTCCALKTLWRKSLADCRVGWLWSWFFHLWRSYWPISTWLQSSFTFQGSLRSNTYSWLSSTFGP